jgi:hypothetical protein
MSGMEKEKGKLNPDWENAIKKAMHSSIMNDDGTDEIEDEHEHENDELFGSVSSPKRALSPSPSETSSGFKPEFSFEKFRNQVAASIETDNPSFVEKPKQVPFRFNFPSNPPTVRKENTMSDSESSNGHNQVSNTRKNFFQPSRRQATDTESESGSQKSVSAASGSSSVSRRSRQNARRERQKIDEEQEKYELLSRLQQLQQEKGYMCFRKLTPNDSIHDVRYEFFRAQRDISKRTNLRLMQKGLVSFTSMVEMLTEYYNPFHLKLNGYSKSVLLSMKDYDPILEELHYKYSESVNLGPEMKLIMALGSSMFFYHAGHNMVTNDDSQPRVVPVPMSKPSSLKTQTTMRGPSINRVSVADDEDDNPRRNAPTMPMPDPLSMLTGLMGQGGGLNGNPLFKVGDIMSGLNMVKTLMNNPDLA